MSSTLRPSTASLGFGLLPKTKPEKAVPQLRPDANRQARVMLVDNDPSLRRLISARLGAANYAVESVDSPKTALDLCVRSRPNLVITDLRLAEMDGMAFLRELKCRWPDLTVIILTAHGTIREAVAATQCGAFGFLVKPIEKDELLGQVERAIANSTFKLVDGDWRANIVSRSQLMEDRLAHANRAAGTDAPVLVTGENGTGKELLARAIHAASPRRERPFVTVNCRAADEAELEALLFGHAPGEHTTNGSAFERARDGTLLLDEIGELAIGIQRKLIDAFRDDCNVRLICTTSSDLKKLIEENRFREDLYYRISVLPIEIPPLGRRREDIPLLVSHFLEQATEKHGQKKIYSPKAIQLLATTDWPGNVRQLFELVKQNVALSDGSVMSADLVQKSLGKEPPRVPGYHEARDQFSRDYLADNLRGTEGNVSKSARLAKRNRTDFYKLLARYRIQPEDFKVVPGVNANAADGEESQTA